MKSDFEVRIPISILKKNKARIVNSAIPITMLSKTKILDQPEYLVDESITRAHNTNPNANKP